MMFSEPIYMPELTAGQIETLKQLVRKKIVSYNKEKVVAGTDRQRIDNNIQIMQDILNSLEDATKDEL